MGGDEQMKSGRNVLAKFTTKLNIRWLIFLWLVAAFGNQEMSCFMMFGLLVFRKLVHAGEVLSVGEVGNISEQIIDSEMFGSPRGGV